MRKLLEFIVAVCFLASLFFATKKLETVMTETAKVETTCQVALDPGHGGCDPGKVGVNGCKEKDINLEIAKKVEEMLTGQGIQVVITRTEDDLLTEEWYENRKLEDMRKRVAVIDGSHPKLAVSIHQNSYHEEAVSGPQVFYFSKSEEGKVAAESIQSALNLVAEGEPRSCKGNDTYYLLKKTKVPTVIVECGFLSNWAEAERLNTEEYQWKMAEGICTGVLDYLKK